MGLSCDKGVMGGHQSLCVVAIETLSRPQTRALVGMQHPAFSCTDNRVETA